MQLSPFHDRRLELSHAVNHLCEAILRGDTTAGLLQSLVDIAGPVLRVDRALIYDVQLGPQLVVGLCEWLRPGADIASTRAAYPLRLFASAARHIASTHAPIESSRDAVHPLLAMDGADELLHQRMSIQRLLWYPFGQRPDGFYLLVFNQVIENRQWTAEEVDFVNVVAAQVSLAIMKSDLQERTAANLRKSEARYRLLYDNTPSMFFTVDREGVVRGTNRFAIEHLGYSSAELVGQSVLRVVHSQDHVAVMAHLGACFADPGTVRTLSFRKIRQDGSTIWVKEITRVVDGPDGANALILCEDVTAARAAEDAARQAESRSHDKDEFLAMLGHELRNPLAPIVTSLEILRARGVRDSELEVIRRQVSHLRRLVDDLLDVSRTVRGQVKLHTLEVELGVVIAQAMEVAQPIFQEKRQILKVDVAPSGLVVEADPSRLVQVFSNLLNNAAKYGNEGQEVQVTAERHRDRIVVRVRDQGEGIEPEMLERVFDHFVQRPQPVDRAQSGLGLGLTIVRNLITLHGGTVRAESEGKGKGATLVVDLPAALGAQPSLPVPSEDNPAALALGADAVGAVLVVEDNEDLRTSLCGLLTMLGYGAIGVADGRSALAVADQIQPRVALVDIGLPGMDGYEVARQLRSSHPTGLRLLALTGYGQDSDRARSRAAGFDAHLTKPIDIDVLLPHLANVSSAPVCQTTHTDQTSNAAVAEP
jgi:PAS domain S-box-containing protein